MRAPPGTDLPSPTCLSPWAPVRARARRWTPPAVPTLVVVPHPDDEALAFGVLLARQRARRVPITVLAVTDGEAAYPADDAAALAATRRAEQRDALADLGVTHGVVRLGLPDAHVASHEDALAAAIAAATCGGRHALVAAPWVADGHPDHDACGRAAARATAGTGALLVHGLFWAWQRATPDQLGGHRLLALTGRRAELDARSRALARHTSQMASPTRPEPVLGERDLAPLTWSREYYVRNEGGRP